MEIATFDVLLFIHIISLIIGFGAVFVVDAFGFAWLVKTYRVDLSLLRKVANITQRLIWLGFAGLVASGLPMLLMKESITNLTKLKLFLVLMVGLNGIFLHYIKKNLDELGDVKKVPSKIFFRISFASAISQLGWWSATLIGFYNTNISRDTTWPSNFITIPIIIVFVLGLVAVIGESVTSKK